MPILQKKVQIVAIDDDEDILYTIKEICKLRDWAVFPCQDYQTAMEMIKRDDIDVFLVDYHLPQVDGVQIVKQIKKRLPYVPVIVLTVEEGHDVAQRFMQAGANDYALKPIRAVDLLSRIQAHLKYVETNRFNYSNTTKGISSITLHKIQEVIQNNGEWLEVNSISRLAEIPIKSIYRYIRYLQSCDLLEIRHNYGDKIGRPRTYYRWKKKDD